MEFQNSISRITEIVELIKEKQSQIEEIKANIPEFRQIEQLEKEIEQLDKSARDITKEIEMPQDNHSTDSFTLYKRKSAKFEVVDENMAKPLMTLQLDEKVVKDKLAEMGSELLVKTYGVNAVVNSSVIFRKK